MFCKNCGNELNDNNAFCYTCGAANEKGNTKANAPTRKKSRKFIVVIIALVIIALGAGSGYAYYRISLMRNNQNEKSVIIEDTNDDKGEKTEKSITKTKESTNDKNQSTNVSDYVDGALRHIVVPPGKSIEIPNTSDGSLPIQWKGIANIMEITEDQKVQSMEYNEATTSGSASIKRHAKVILQNSGSSDVTVSVSYDYTQYSETDSVVYDTIELNNSESISFTAKQSDTIYLDDSTYDCIEYKADNMSLESSGVKGSRSVNISEKNVYFITATEPLIIHYCPLTIERIAQDKSAFKKINVASGKTVRIYATDKSKNMVYTDNSRCDYVIYGTDGTVKQQKQDIKIDSISINKNCYVDFTNISANQTEIKIPNLGFNVEER